MLSNDLLRGVPAIAGYIGLSVRAAYHLVEKEAIPVFRLPSNTTIYARKSELDRHFSANVPDQEPTAEQAHAA